MEKQTLAGIDLTSVFESQKRKALQLKKSSASERIARLQKLKEVVNQNTEKILEALHKDFKKPAEEANWEISPITGEIDFVCAFLESWMQPQSVPTPELLGGEASKSKILVEPKGVCLFLTPWNYPFLLTIRPMISCIAAGNTIILKPSEVTPHSSGIIKEIMESVFPEDEVFVIEGGAEVASELLKMPFNHIFYTGGTRVGKIVMKAAAEHLASVTLELGGKSPVVVDDSADFADAAGKLVWGKFFNCGQTCITVDYILVSENRKDEFIASMKATAETMYGTEGPGIENPKYARLSNNHHFNRVKNLLDDALENGAKIITGGKTDAAENYISPTLLDNVSPNLAIMQEEIFGPLLPVLTYKTLDDAIDFINERPRPLGVYYFGKNEENKEKLISSTTAGATVVNQTAMHYFSPFLPFGGVGNSGIGRAHGQFGFMDFSNQRPVLEMP